MSLILSGTDGLSDVDGSAATPAIRGTDANTGIFFGADIIGFAEGGAEAMRIDSSGNVGIGTTTPNSKLTSQTATTSTSVFSFANQLNNSYASNDSISALGFHVRADVNGTGVGAAIAFSGGGTSDGSGNLIFCIKPTGNIATVVAPSNEKMRIDSSGNLLVGATTQYETEKLGVTSSNIAALFVGTNTGNVTTLQIRRANTDGDAVTFFHGTSQKGYITVASTGTTYNTLSDYRLKENVQPMVGALQKISALKPVTYDWKDIGKTGQGFIAHELKTIVPECVTGEKDELDDDGNPRYQGIDTSFLVATLTAAIQEQQALITSQQAMLASLTARITALETP